MVDIAKLAIEVDASQATAAAKQLQALQGAAVKTDTAVQKSNGSFRMASNGVQMMGYQVQDVAVQLGMGTSPFVVLAQQGSQIASIFGPGGAVIGALLAVSGAIAGPLVASLMRSTENTDKMSEAIRSLREELNAITEQQTIKALKQETDQLQKGLQMLSSPVRDVREEGEELLETLTGVSAGFLSNSELIVAAQSRLRENNRLIKQQKELIEETNAARLQEFGPSSEAFYQARWDAEKKLAKEALEADSMRLASRANALKSIESLEAAQMSQQEKLTDNYLTQQSQISAALGAGVIAVEEANALKLASDQQYAAASQQITDQQTQAQLAAYATTLTAMQGFSSAALAAVEAYGEESSDLGKGLLLASKVLSVAQAVMAAELSAVMTRAAYASAAMFAGPGAPAVLAAGEAHANLNRGLGYASAALIAATEFAPARALGGQVQAGTSYLVGERGPELVTMGANGYVTPNDKLGVKSAPVINVIEDASKAGTQEVQQMGEQDIINIFVSNIQRGGAAARAMQGAYGLRRAAR